jgi:hypothetical protein
MYFVKIYFVLGLAMALVVLWDYKKLPQTARRLTRQLPEHGSQFSQIALEVRNMAVMFLFAFFLWPVVVYMEVSRTGGKE